MTLPPYGKFAEGALRWVEGRVGPERPAPLYS